MGWMKCVVRQALLVTETDNVRLDKALKIHSDTLFLYVTSRTLLASANFDISSQAPLFILIINRTLFFGVILGIEKQQVICFRPKKWVIVLP